MTEQNNAANWTSDQTWIKDVLSKSGTELTEISTTSSRKNGSLKKFVQKPDKGDPQNKMVYYQSTSLIIKPEQSSQSQFCTPLRSAINTFTEPSMQHHAEQPSQQIAQDNYSISKIGTVMQDLGTVIDPSQQTLDLTNSSLQKIFNNVKVEHLPSDNTIYASSSSSSSASLIASSSSGSQIRNITMEPTAGANFTTPKRKTSINKQQFKCEQCGMSFGSKSAHTSHSKSHSKNLGLVVGTSGSHIRQVVNDVNESIVLLGIPKTPQIKANNSGALGGDPYQCNVCQKTFAVPARLIRHYRTHTGERPFECEFCHKLFSVKENLQVHRRIHTKERPYKCDVCGRAFEHSGKLHRHMRIHTGERPHKCSVCEKTFIQSGQLVIHMRTHTGEKPYKCPVDGCGKGFTCSKQLKVHSRTHTGEKPYHCDICFRDFGYNHVLKLHRVQHYGSKCYKCTICDETFKSKKEMEAHIKGHANELPNDEESVMAAESNQIETSSHNNAISSQCSPHSEILTRSSIKTLMVNAEPAPNPLRLSSDCSPISPKSPPSPISSLASVSRLSAGSPVSSVLSPIMKSTLENENHDYVNAKQLSSLNIIDLKNQITLNNEELPTDLRIQQQQQQQQQQLESTKYYQEQEKLQEDEEKASYNSFQNIITFEPPTINPALLEAASIASRRLMLDPGEDLTETSLEIMKLHHSQQKHKEIPILVNPHSQQKHKEIPITHSSPSSVPLVADLSNYDDTHEANELIEHYKRGELAQHGIHKGFAPVPKFESSLQNNEIIVRQVEAAIAPLRSSTESPERSSSPESDSMMMADRDVMTLPLRKRKLYMNEVPRNDVPTEKTNVNNVTNNDDNTSTSSGNAGNEMGTRIMRMNSVIQFAKAS